LTYIQNATKLDVVKNCRVMNKSDTHNIQLFGTYLRYDDVFTAHFQIRTNLPFHFSTKTTV